jgi:hypothetical protein
LRGPENNPQDIWTMPAQDGSHLGAQALAAAPHLLGSVDSASTPASRHSSFLESQSDHINLSPAPEALTATRSVQSGLTTAPASPSSESATPDESESAAVAPYGTRSRQRTGGSRPNYAEDKDVDMDTEMNGVHTKPVPARRKGGATDATLLLEGVSDAPTRPGFSRWSAINGSPKSESSNAQVPKEWIPGTSTFAAQSTAATTSKKRKQPGSSMTASTGTAYSVASRSKGSSATNGRFQQPETNMMTFERCGGYLNVSGQLKADDGTLISVNGENLAPSPGTGIVLTFCSLRPRLFCLRTSWRALLFSTYHGIFACKE